MKIRLMTGEDISRVVDLWYEVSLEAHSFIPAAYWQDKREAMATRYLPRGETHLAVTKNEVKGFASVVGNYLAAVFVQRSAQGKGFGKGLLNYVKGKRVELELKVYIKNYRSVQFYLSQGFVIVGENMDKETGEIEYEMRWQRL